MFSRKKLVSLFNRLTALAEKLPKRLSHPILKELTPIREIFLEQRPARLLFLGESLTTVPELLETWCNAYPTIGHTEQGWRTYSLPDRGTLQILDARQDFSVQGKDSLGQNFLETFFQTGISNQSPDVAVVFAGSTINQNDLLRLKKCTSKEGRKCPILLLNINNLPEIILPNEFQDHEVRVVVSPSATAATLLCELLPDAAKLEMARVLKAKDAQHYIANKLLHAFAAVCGVIGMQPIPLADLPILISLQSFMVGIIAYCSGRSLRPRTIAEFLGAVGLNIGAGIIFREGARTVVRLVPFWGSTISGFVAGAGTYAIGKAAIAYFIDRNPITPGILSKWEKPKNLPPPS